MATFTKTTTTTSKGSGKATVHYNDAPSTHSSQSPPYHEAMSVSVASSAPASPPQVASNTRPFRIPISPAPHGYQHNEWASDVEISHQIMDHVLNPKITPLEKWEGECESEAWVMEGAGRAHSAISCLAHSVGCAKLPASRSGRAPERGSGTMA